MGPSAPVDGLVIDLKSPLRRIRWLYHRSTSRWRVLPDFVILGTQRGGTTSLYQYLSRHPCLISSYGKEVHYFDLNYDRDVRWYRSHFPLAARVSLQQHLTGDLVLTGEGSPYYLFHPAVPRRLHCLLPEVKLIVLLRNPVDRAYSHYHHEVRKGRENLEFEEAIAREEDRIGDISPDQWKRADFYSWAHHRHSYLSRGLYAEQIERWLEYFPRYQLFVCESEKFFEDEQAVLDEVHEFLGLPSLTYGSHPVPNPGSYAEEMSPELRARLEQRFEPHNRRLSELLDLHLTWESPNSTDAKSTSS